MTITIRLKPALFARLSKQADREKISIQELARRVFDGVFTPRAKTSRSAKSVSI